MFGICACIQKERERAGKREREEKQRERKGEKEQGRERRVLTLPFVSKGGRAPR